MQLSWFQLIVVAFTETVTTTNESCQKTYSLIILQRFVSAGPSEVRRRNIINPEVIASDFLKENAFFFERL